MSSIKSFRIYNELVATSVNTRKLEAEDASITIRNRSEAPLKAPKGGLYYNTIDDIIYYGDGSNWNPFGAGGGGSAITSGVITGTGATISTAIKLVDGASGTENILKWNGSAWSTVTATLDTFSDVQITTPSTGQFLKYNGTQWVNSALSLLIGSSLTGDGISTSLNIRSGSGFGDYLYYTGTEWNIASSLPSGSTYHGIDAANISAIGINNTTTGKDSMKALTTGESNTADGKGALTAIKGGSYNSAFGSLAGSSLVGGNDNSLFGYNAQTLGASDNNSIVIGSGATGKGSNTIVFGNTSSSGIYIFGIDSAGGDNYIRYDSTTKELSYSNLEVKTAVNGILSGDGGATPLSVNMQAVSGIGSIVSYNSGANTLEYSSMYADTGFPKILSYDDNTNSFGFKDLQLDSSLTGDGMTTDLSINMGSTATGNIVSYNTLSNQLQYSAVGTTSTENILSWNSSTNSFHYSKISGVVGLKSLGVVTYDTTAKQLLYTQINNTPTGTNVVYVDETTGTLSYGPVGLSTVYTDGVNVQGDGSLGDPVAISTTITGTAGVLHSDGLGAITSSTIVNADIDASAGIVDTKLATISTAGKVANSATTATSSNTVSAIVARDGSGNFSAGTITASLTGSASNNVLKSGDTMTGDLQLPSGSTSNPSLQFTGSTSSGLSCISDSISFIANGAETMNISSSGDLTINNLTTGVVHSDSSGVLTSSLIVDADIDASAGIVDTKLDTISTAGKVANSATTATSSNTINTIVLRDGSGNFSAGTITASLTGSASNNVLKSGDTMSGDLQLPAGTTSNPSLQFTGSTTTGLSAVSDSLSLISNGSERINISSTGDVSVKNLSTGIVHSDSSGVLTSSLIVDADIDASAGIVDTKLATISTAGKVSNSATTATSSNTTSAIVSRDGSGNFSAGTITASLTGSASLNVLKSGDTMSGALQLPAGSTASPSLKFTGSTSSGISCTSDAVSISSNGVEVMKLDGTNSYLQKIANGSASNVLYYDETTGLITYEVPSGGSLPSATVKGQYLVYDGSDFVAVMGASDTNFYMGYDNLTDGTFSGTYNYVSGFEAGKNITSGSYNLIQGYGNLPSLTTGSYNYVSGLYNGFSISNPSETILIGSYNCYDADAGSQSATTSTIIGTKNNYTSANSTGTISNTASSLTILGYNNYCLAGALTTTTAPVLSSSELVIIGEQNVNMANSVSNNGVITLSTKQSTYVGLNNGYCGITYSGAAHKYTNSATLDTIIGQFNYATTPGLTVTSTVATTINYNTKNNTVLGNYNGFLEDFPTGNRAHSFTYNLTSSTILGYQNYYIKNNNTNVNTTTATLTATNCVVVGDQNAKYNAFTSGGATTLVMNHNRSVIIGSYNFVYSIASASGAFSSSSSDSVVIGYQNIINTVAYTSTLTRSIIIGYSNGPWKSNSSNSSGSGLVYIGNTINPNSSSAVSGHSNIVISPGQGYSALNTTSSNNIILGGRPYSGGSGFSVNDAKNHSIHIGWDSLYSITSQSNLSGSVIIGNFAAARANVTSLVVIGYTAFAMPQTTLTSTGEITVVGMNSFDFTNVGGSATISAVTAFGTSAGRLYSNSSRFTGSNSIVGTLYLGQCAGYINAVTGSSTITLNVTGDCYIGRFSGAMELLSETTLQTITRIQNVAVGYYTLGGSNTGKLSSRSCQYNAIVGSYSLSLCTSASYNSCLGDSTMKNATSATYCIAVGYNAMLTGVTTGSDLICIGRLAGTLLTSGVDCIYMGQSTGAAATATNYMIAIGSFAGQTMNLTTDGAFFGIGYKAGNAITTSGTKLMFIGYQAGLKCTGDINLFIGKDAGANATTETDSILLGHSTDTATYSDVILIGHSVSATASSSVVINVKTANTGGLFCNALKNVNNSNYVLYDSATGELTYDTLVPSSNIYKENIRSFEGNNFIQSANVVTFEYNNVISKLSGKTDHGLIAQEVASVYPECLIWVGGQIYGIDYSRLTVPLIVECQRLNSTITTLEDRVEELETENSSLNVKIASLENSLATLNSRFESLLSRLLISNI